MDAHGNFDVDGLLNMEKRTGIKKDDIDDFLKRAKEVEQKIDDIKVRAPSFFL